MGLAQLDSQGIAINNLMWSNMPYNSICYKR